MISKAIIEIKQRFHFEVLKLNVNDKLQTTRKKTHNSFNLLAEAPTEENEMFITL